ncbi:BTB domain-containing protein [Caerostris extrusa]|uniref:BTB domain-containing protein n=1 Tax=Caerostris extrusa TaxID=172846 RepID=A0AAV4NI03_CAEEX|nr:BTB domain-containing protein [Caerostris extrusa]
MLDDGKNHVKEVIECVLSDEGEHDCPETDNKNEDKWNLVIETKDGAIFNIPFESGKKTLGSKLVESSPVFERMLINPMREKFEKKVILHDVHFEIFLKFLNFIQFGQLNFSKEFEVYYMYEFADEYQVSDLMRASADGMRPYMTMQNNERIEMLAYLHSDSYLKGLVDFFKNQDSVQNFSNAEEMDDEEEMDMECDSSFDFYQ